MAIKYKKEYFKFKKKTIFHYTICQCSDIYIILNFVFSVKQYNSVTVKFQQIYVKTILNILLFIQTLRKDNWEATHSLPILQNTIQKQYD